MNGLVVVKLGGTTVAGQTAVLTEIASVALERPVVVVHGGGGQVTEWLTRLGQPTRFEDGLRVTDEASMEVVAAVLRGSVNTALVAALRRLGVDAVGLSGVDGGLLVGERLPGRGLVATVAGVRRTLIDTLVADGCVAVIAPLACDETGTVCNVNADDVAAGLARGLAAELLVLLTDTDGVRGDDGARIPWLAADHVETLIGVGTIDGGMAPKVRAALAAVSEGDATSAIIADGGTPRVLERAMAGDDIGTRIVAHVAARPAAATAPEHVS